MTDDRVKEVIKETADAELLMKTLGFQVTRSTSSEVRSPCIIHGGDNPTAFSLRLDTKRWRCFTHHCEQSSGGVDNDLFALVMRCLNCSFKEALNYLSDFTGVVLDAYKDSNASYEYQRMKDNNRYIKEMSRITSKRSEIPKLSEELVSSYVKQRDSYFVEKGFLPETLEEFEIGAKIDKHGVRRATVPIRDMKGNLVSVSARREDGDEDPRYLLDYEFKKGQVLYNLHKATLTEEDTVVIVEGFKALWAVYESGFSNVIACMGSMLTREQAFILCSTHFKNCAIMFDGDEAGRKGAKKSNELLSSYFNTTVVALPDGLSPDDLKRSELRELIELYLCCFI